MSIANTSVLVTVLRSKKCYSWGFTSTKNRKILFKTGVTTQERVVKICNETATVSPFTNVEGIVRIYPLRFAKHTKGMNMRLIGLIKMQHKGLRSFEFLSYRLRGGLIAQCRISPFLCPPHQSRIGRLIRSVSVNCKVDGCTSSQPLYRFRLTAAVFPRNALP